MLEVKLNMNDVKCNYKNGYKNEQLECFKCNQELENNEHLFECELLQNYKTENMWRIQLKTVLQEGTNDELKEITKFFERVEELKLKNSTTKEYEIKKILPSTKDLDIPASQE